MTRLRTVGQARLELSEKIAFRKNQVEDTIDGYIFRAIEKLQTRVTITFKEGYNTEVLKYAEEKCKEKGYITNLNLIESKLEISW